MARKKDQNEAEAQNAPQGDDDRDYEAEAQAARDAEAEAARDAEAEASNQGQQSARGRASGTTRGAKGDPAEQPQDGPPTLSREAADEEARKIEGEGKADAGPATEAQQVPEGTMPTLARDEAAQRAAEQSEGDPARRPGQPPVADPNRAPTAEESALNAEVATRKGDTAPMHPSQTAAAREAEQVRPAEGRRFRVIHGGVGGFRTGPNGEPSRPLSLAELNITEEMIPRLLQKGVISEEE